MDELLEKMAYCSGTNKPTGKFRRHRRFLHLPIKWRGNWWINSFIEDQKRVMKLWAPQGILLHLHHNCHQLCLLKERNKFIGAHIFVSSFYAATNNFLQEVSSKGKLCYVIFLIVCLPYIDKYQLPYGCFFMAISTHYFGLKTLVYLEEFVHTPGYAFQNLHIWLHWTNN